MPGALTHLGAAALLALAVHRYHFRTEFSLAVFVGHLLPDGLKFGLTALKQLTWKVFFVDMTDPFYLKAASITGSYANWFTLGFFALGLTVLLYHHHAIRKRTMMEYDELVLFLLLGVVTHLFLDGLIDEKSAWI